jgi:hypothetical protein
MVEARTGGFFCLAYVGECAPVIAGRTWREVGRAFADLVERANPPAVPPPTPDKLRPHVVAFMEENLDMDSHDDNYRSYLSKIVDSCAHTHTQTHAHHAAQQLRSAVVHYPGWHAWTQEMNDEDALVVCVGVHDNHFRACCLRDHPIAGDEDCAYTFQLNAF